MDFDKKVSIIIPCYNEEEIIQKTHTKVKNVLDKCNLHLYEIIYIHDSSHEGTSAILEAAVAVANAIETLKELTKRGYEVKEMRTESGDCLYSYHQFLIQTPSGGEVRIAGSLVWFENVKREELYELRGFIKEIFSQGKFV